MFEFKFLKTISQTTRDNNRHQCLKVFHGASLTVKPSELSERTRSDLDYLTP